MNQLLSISTITGMLTSDVHLGGGLHSPVISCVGALGMVLFFAWHVMRMFRHVSGARAAYARVWPTVSHLWKERCQGDQDWLTLRVFGDVRQSRHQNPRPVRIDVDDVQALDTTMRQEPLFRRTWMQFRKTYAVEQTSWFIEPRVFSTKPAGEYFSEEQLLAGRMNTAFYHQLPSLMTGIGLLFTFLAILIGLSRLHAEGTQIVGIQGLINGLAGKFFTSVVGLVCANVFVMLEKSWTHGLTSWNCRLIARLDELFPRLTVEQLMEHRAPAAAAPAATPAVDPEELANRLGATIADRLSPLVTAMTSTMQTVSQRVSRESSSHAATAGEIAKGVREGLAHPLHALEGTLAELTQTVGRFNHAQDQAQQHIEELAARLTVDLSHLGDVLDQEPLQEGGMGHRWLTTLRQRVSARGAA